MIVWHHLKRLAFQSGKTIYQLKSGLLSDYLRSQLNHPSIWFLRKSSKKPSMLPAARATYLVFYWTI